MRSTAVINRLRVVKIREVKKESPTVKTFTFQDRLCGRARPGQFLMVWIPGVDEVPMSLSSMQPNGYSSICVAEVGDATESLHKKKLGEKIGVRGPYGNGFTVTSGNVLVVAGGTGIAPILPLVENLVKTHARITIVFGAGTRDELVLLDRLEAAVSGSDSKIVATTEDGSYGLKGLATDPLDEVLGRISFDMVYTCGAEQMIHKMFLLAEMNEIPIQASLERFMRCGIGLCGSCMLGPFRVCKDGPVFSSEQLRQAKSEFGHMVRGRDGRKLIL